MKIDKTKARRNAVIAIDKATILAGKVNNLAMNIPVASKISQKVTYRVNKTLMSQNRDGEHLSPLLEVLRRARRLSSPPKKRTVQNLRASYASDMHGFRRYFEVGHVQDMSIPLTQNKVDLAARFYRPNVLAQQSVLPVLLVYFHGGGFVMGDLDTHDDACRLLCQHAGMPVLSVDYRLAPEHPYPTAINDSKEVLAWIMEHKARFGAEYVAVGGDSAGANLATVIAQARAHDLKKQKTTPKKSLIQKVTGTKVKKNTENHLFENILAQLLIYPPTDASTTTESERLYDDGYFLDAIDRKLYYADYLQKNDSLKKHVEVSPLLNDAITDLAPALLVTAGFDMLCDEGIAYAEHMQAHKVPVQTLHYGRLPHAFVNFASIHHESQVAMEEIAQSWRKMCEKLIEAP